MITIYSQWFSVSNLITKYTLNEMYIIYIII